MEQKSILVIRGYHLAPLLLRPGGGRKGSHLAVNRTPSPMLDDDEHVLRAEARGDGEAEVTAEDSLGMETQEG